MRLNASMKMADMIHQNYHLLTIINRFGIKLGFGDKTIESVCREYGINLDFFLDIVNAFHDEDYFPQSHLQSFSVQLIVDFLIKTHDYYHQVKIPEIEGMIDDMIQHCYQEKEKIGLLQKFFKDYKEELKTHTDYEENVVFPYALKIEENYNDPRPGADFRRQFGDYSMEHYLQEHDDVETKLFELKNIIIKYLPPPKSNYHCNKVLYELFQLERDLNDHSRIEEKVMAPKIEAMEKARDYRLK